MKRLIFLLGLVLPFCLHPAQAQDPQFSQFYSNQVLLSPAFTGAGEGPRLAMNFRNQWPSIPNSFITGAVSFDMPFYFGARSRFPRHGLGVSLLADQAGAGNLQQLQAVFSYSYLISLGRNYDHNIRLGVGGGIRQTSIDFFRLRFGDAIDPVNGPSTTAEALGADSRTNEEFRAGIVYYNEVLYIGGTVHHLTEPEQTFLATGQAQPDERDLPMRIDAFAGVNIPLNSREGLDGPTISPGARFRSQDPFTTVDLGTYINLDPLVVGGWWRLDDAIIGLVGIQTGQFRFGYSYDFTISDLDNSTTGGSHEVSVVVEFGKITKGEHTPQAKMSCPKY